MQSPSKPRAERTSITANVLFFALASAVLGVVAVPSGATAKSGGGLRAVLSQPVPDDPQKRARYLEDLYALLATAESSQKAGAVATKIERMWLDNGSPTIAVLMERSLKAMKSGDLDLSIELLNAVVELAPDYAEGWNRRAYIHYKRNDVRRTLGDLRRTLALEPNHFKALDGLGQILRDLGRKKAALKAFEKLIEIHPNFPGAEAAYKELRREVEGQGI